MQKCGNKNPCSIAMYVKVTQYSCGSPVTSLSISYYNYFNLLIFCQPSASNTIKNKGTQLFTTFLSIYRFSPLISRLSHSCIVSGKDIAILQRLIPLFIIWTRKISISPFPLDNSCKTTNLM